MKLKLLILASALLSSACQSVQVKGPVGDMQVTMRWGPLDGPKRKPAAIPPLFQDLTPGKIILEWAEEGLSFSGQVNPDTHPVGKKVYALAKISGEIIGKELGLGFTPGFVILLVECRPEERVVVSGDVPIAYGSFAALRMAKGVPDDSDYGLLLSIMAHEFTEAQFMYPDNLNCNLYSGTPYNRWVGDGAAELVTSLCERRARAEGLDFVIPESENSVFKTTPALQTVNLSRWKSAYYIGEHEKIDGIEQRLRYLGSEYLVWLYYQGAQERGIAYPLARLAKWIGFHSPSPRPKDLIAWMGRTSGVDLAARVESLSVEEIINYHDNKFSILPLRYYPEVEVIPRDNWKEFEELYSPSD